MLARIARHEWRNLAADRTLLWVAVLFTLIIGYGVANGVAWARAQENEQQTAEAAFEERLEKLRQALANPPQSLGRSDPDPTSPRYVGGSSGKNAFLPPTVLAALSVGQGDLLPNRVGVSLSTSRWMLTRNYELENPVLLLAGRFDLAFAVVYLFPLLILAISYNLLSSEKEQGTLALALSQPVLLRTLVWGKVGVRFILVVGLGIGLSLLGVLLSGAPILSPGGVLRLLLWCLVVLAYGAFWFALALVVSARGQASASNAVTLAALWLVFVVIVPAALGLVVNALYPMPSRNLLIEATREASTDVEKQGAQTLAKYFQDHPELLPAGGQADFEDFTARRYAAGLEIERKIGPVLDAYDLQLQRQQALVRRVQIMSPAVMVQEAFNDIAGTGLGRHRAFREQALAFVEAWKAYFMPRILRKEKLVASDYAQLPSFRFVEEPLGRLVERVAWALIGLIVPALLLGTWGLRALARFPLDGLSPSSLFPRSGADARSH